MSKLPKPPFESILSRKRNIHPSPSKSSRSTHSNPLTASAMTTTKAASTDNLNEFSMDADEPRVGDRVLVDTKQLYGTLRYLGPTDFKPGKWAGIELDYQGTGKNDGTVKGIQYFTCAANTGIFVLSSKITLVSRNSSNITKKKNPRVNTSTSMCSSLPSPSPSSPSRPASTSISVSSSISASPLSATIASTASSPSSTLRKQSYGTNKYSQRTVFNNNVTPIPSVVASEHVGQHRTQHVLRSSQLYESYPSIDDSAEQHTVDQQRQEIGHYQVKLGREQHRVYELRKEREHLVQQVQQSNQQLAQQHQVMQQWQQSQDRIQQLEASERDQTKMVEQLNKALEQAQATHRKESAQLLEQQSQLIQELQRERHQHDFIQTRLRHVEQACQSLMDPFDVRPGLDLVDQLKETQRQVKDLLQKARDDTDLKNQQRRDIVALHRDVTHLESLIDTKYFKEADLLATVELEQEQNRQLRQELALMKANTSTTSLPRHRRKRKSGKSAATPTAATAEKRTTNSSSISSSSTLSSNASINTKVKKHSMDSAVVLTMDNPRWASGSSVMITTGVASLSGDDDDDDDDDDHHAFCEICDTVGHDLMTCTHVTMDASVTTKSKYSSIPLALPMDASPILQHKVLSPLS